MLRVRVSRVAGALSKSLRPSIGRTRADSDRPQNPSTKSESVAVLPEELVTLAPPVAVALQLKQATFAG